ncbi:reverse transcriptase domain-containing protein [Tanacetum coccineum]
MAGIYFSQGPIYQPQVNQPPAYQAPVYQASIPQTQGVSKTDFDSYVKANDAVMRNMQNQNQVLQNQGQNLQAQLNNLATSNQRVESMLSNFIKMNTASTSGSGTLPVMNRDTEVTKDTMLPTNNGSTEDVQPPNSIERELLSSHPIGIAKDVRLMVGKFQFPADFVVVDFEPDPRVPLILGRSFLKTSRALIDVYEGKITLRVGKEAITFNLDQTSRYTANYDHMTANRIDVIELACEEYSQEVLGFSDSVAYAMMTEQVFTGTIDAKYYDPWRVDILISRECTSQCSEPLSSSSKS